MGVAISGKNINDGTNVAFNGTKIGGIAANGTVVYRASAFVFPMFNKLPDPASPVGINGMEWASNNTYQAMAGTTANAVTHYNWNSGVPVFMTKPSGAPTDTAQSCTWSPDGQHSAFITINGVYITNWSSGLPVMAPALPSQTTNNTYIDWSAQDDIIVTRSTTPYTGIWNWNNGSPIKLTNLTPELPGGTSYDIKFNGSGNKVAIMSNASPFVLVYIKQGADSWVKAANPTPLSPGLGRSCAWLGEDILFVGISTSPYLQKFQVIDNALVELPVETIPLSQAITALEVSANHEILVIGTSRTQALFPFIAYSIRGNKLEKIPDTNIDINPAGAITKSTFMSFRQDNQVFSTAHGGTPWIANYRIK